MDLLPIARSVLAILFVTLVGGGLVLQVRAEARGGPDSRDRVALLLRPVGWYAAAGVVFAIVVALTLAFPEG